MKLPLAVTSAVARQVLVLQKHSPVLMFGAGAVSVVAGTVLACRATLKVDEVLKEGERVKAKIVEATNVLPDEEYSDEDRKKDIKTSSLQVAIGIAKLYAPAVLLVGGGLALLTGSHVILTKRNAGLTAAYAALDKMFKGYRARVVADLGEDKDQEYYFDKIDKEIYVEDVNGGRTEIVQVNGPGGRSDYARCFEKGNLRWQPDFGYNSMFIATQQTWANNQLKSKGHLFLNDVYRALGFEDTPAGAVTGWIDGGDGDDVVVFDIFDDHEAGSHFVNGAERSVWVDFNVDGVIYDKI